MVIKHQQKQQKLYKQSDCLQSPQKLLFPIGADFYQFEIVLMPPATGIKCLNIYILITQNLPLLITCRPQ